MNATPSFYIIAYDLNKPGQDYDRMEEKISQLEETCKILDTTWIVKTNLTTKEIKNTFWRRTMTMTRYSLHGLTFHLARGIWTPTSLSGSMRRNNVA